MGREDKIYIIQTLSKRKYLNVSGWQQFFGFPQSNSVRESLEKNNVDHILVNERTVLVERSVFYRLSKKHNGKFKLPPLVYSPESEMSLQKASMYTGIGDNVLGKMLPPLKVVHINRGIKDMYIYTAAYLDEFMRRLASGRSMADTRENDIGDLDFRARGEAKTRGVRAEALNAISESIAEFAHRLTAGDIRSFMEQNFGLTGEDLQ